MNIRSIKSAVSVALVCAMGLWSSPASAESASGKVLSVRGGMSYLEIEMDTQICTSGGISSDWGKKPRISFGGYTAESVQSLAIAALLSGKQLKVYATVNGSGGAARCQIDSVLLLA